MNIDYCLSFTIVPLGNYFYFSDFFFFREIWERVMSIFLSIMQVSSSLSFLYLFLHNLIYSLYFPYFFFILFQKEL